MGNEIVDGNIRILNKKEKHVYVVMIINSNKNGRETTKTKQNKHGEDLSQSTKQILQLPIRNLAIGCSPEKSTFLRYLACRISDGQL